MFVILSENKIFLRIIKISLDFCLCLWYVVVLQEVANFMDIIKELWYGNVAPFEQCTRGDKRLKELLKLATETKENLNEMHGIAERDAFSYGFRLGVRLTAEAFLQPLCED